MSMSRMTGWVKKGTAFLAVIALLAGNSFVSYGVSEIQYRLNIEVAVDGREAGYIPAVEEDYENNLYISLTGLAHVLEGTDRAFTPEIEKRKINISTGAGEPVESVLWDGEELSGASKATMDRHELYLNGEDRKYYSLILPRDKEYDAFLTPISLAMMFDMEIRVTDGRIEIDTTKPFAVSAQEMEESGYLQGVNALVIGDGTTGEIYYQYAIDRVFPIASTTKLMTYLVFMDAVSRGECSLDDIVTISENAARISASPDGVVWMKAGSKAPVSELLYGMLVPSSNESALALAEHLAGSQGAFVERMNETAREYGWTNAEFYNCHGLPSYEDQLIPAKIHNHMTAGEMFELASVLMETYPQIAQITSAKTYQMQSFGMEIKNTNAVLYNMEEVVGLKTGTTNKAGACLVTCASVEKDGKNHDLIVVLFGAEGDSNRGIVSEIAMRYAVSALRSGTYNLWKNEDDSPEDTGIPADPELVMKRLVENVFFS